MKGRLDDVDVKLIELLQKDGRMSYKDLARLAGVSLPTVRERLRKLQELGVIKKFTAVVNPERIHGKIRAIFTIEAEAQGLEEAATKVAEIRGVREALITTGTFNLIAKVEADDISDIEEFITARLSKIQGIRSVKSSLVIKALKEEYGVSVGVDARLQGRCAFCGGLIVEEPYLEEVEGEWLLFTAKECAEAYKRGRGSRSET